MIEGNNCCVMCGAIIPEGTMICWNCEHYNNMMKDVERAIDSAERTVNLWEKIFIKRKKK